MTTNGLTIAIPVYNEAGAIEQAIRSAAPQCQCLLVSDNASTDGTEAICRALCDEYPNLRYTRQESNIGSLGNFGYLLAIAETPYFMWLGAHDGIPDDYVSTLIAALEAAPDASLAYGHARHVDRNGTSLYRYDYTFHPHLSSDSPTHRLQALVEYLANCSLVHGVFRTDLLKSAWHDGKYLGCDKVLLAKAVLAGRFVYREQTYLVRTNAHADDNVRRQLARITGKSTNAPAVLSPMQLDMYGLAVAASAGMGLRRIGYRFWTRLLLISRYGPFGESALMRAAAYPAAAAIFVAKSIKRMLSPKPQAR